MHSLTTLLLLLTTPVSCLILPFSVKTSRQSPSLCSERTCTSDESTDSSIIDSSTLTLLEHVNLNVPNHDYIVDFYFGLLGFGVDPRRASNIKSKSGTVWTNCGASQLHLPFGEKPHVWNGCIGLRYDSLQPLKERLESGNYKDCYASSKLLENGALEIIDKYGNVFHCHEKPMTLSTSLLQQPLVSTSDVDEYGEVATKYGCDTETECRGIDYVEIKCPPNTTEKIALFYESVFDATTSVVQHGGTTIGIIAIGDIDENGRASQCLLFRETSDPIPPYDGHHLALYVGSSDKDFEQAFKNANLANVVWVNPRFSDDVTTLQGAREWKQFRFKHVVDMQTGECILELEHEVRSIEHSSWPGRVKQDVE